MRNVFHFNIFQNNVDFIINNILQKILRGCEDMFSIVGTKNVYINALSKFYLRLLFFSFTLKIVLPPSFKLNFSFTICLEDISKGIWIVRIGMYFLGFYKVSLNNYITISIAMKSRNKRHRFWEYSLQAQKNLLQIWTFICTPLNISAFAFMQMSMYLHS